MIDVWQGRKYAYVTRHKHIHVRKAQLKFPLTYKSKSNFTLLI